jgi:hypothetical protein
MSRNRVVWSAGVAFVAASFLFAGLVLMLKSSVEVPAINADRAALRVKDLAEIRAAEDLALRQAAWIDTEHGVVRLPIDLAMQMTQQEWRNPAAARSNLTARAEKAFPPPPPPAAAQPSAFE